MMIPGMFIYQIKQHLHTYVYCRSSTLNTQRSTGISTLNGFVQLKAQQLYVAQRHMEHGIYCS